MPDGGRKVDVRPVAWKPQPGPQEALLECPADEILFGGARGGGKTAGSIGLWLAHVGKYGANAQGLFFRRRYRDLDGALLQMYKFFTPLGAVYRSTKGTWTFPSGAVLRLRYMWDERDAQSYQGQEFTFIVYEELGQWPNIRPMDIMRATLRSTAGVKPVMISTGNPGGAGHGWVKARYVSPARKGYKLIRDETGSTRCFIPSKLIDNKILTDADPRYEYRLRQLGSPALVRAWLEGDWDVVVGGAFDDVWHPDRQVLVPFVTPEGWTYRRAFDWGFTKPACLTVWGIADGKPIPGQPDLHFPKGSMILMRELYTVQKDQNGEAIANVGAEMSNDLLGAAIARVSRPLKFEDSVADPSIWIRTGGMSIHDQLRMAAENAGDRWNFVRADNARIAGWQKMRTMMLNSSKPRAEAPGMWVMENNTEWLRTVPVLQRDPLKPDDVDTDGEDHAGDSTRYAAQSRSGTRTGPGVAPIRVM